MPAEHAGQLQGEVPLLDRHVAAAGEPAGIRQGRRGNLRGGHVLVDFLQGRGVRLLSQNGPCQGLQAEGRVSLHQAVGVEGQKGQLIP